MRTRDTESSKEIREDIASILLDARKGENSIYIDTRPPYPEEMARKPYLANYTSFILPKYEGIIRNAREHIRTYVDALTTNSHDHELRLREFSKSLIDQAFTHSILSAGLILNWNDMAT
ncbi:hypothetical protein SO802_017461 [Lithocarpus litseifolius]|uniref:Uncharacterized protein n=1 Tax=Lithocarpus litseifolius TaxID=425828 RepID=A0AAW2CJG9_9ROSI